jgi:hypothetical protein
VADWTTISSLATAGGTLVLAIATFSSVRSGNRSARIAERALQIGLRPVLVPSRFDDPSMKITWREGRRTLVQGGRASVEEDAGDIFLAMSLRNVGSGIAVLQGWKVTAEGRPTAVIPDIPDIGEFRRQGRDLYVPPSDVSFWQGRVAGDDDQYAAVHDSVARQETLTVYLCYSDHEGGQRAVSLFLLDPTSDAQWLCTVVRHWYLDRPDPR